MAVLSRTRAREAQLGFEALSIEGGVISPEWLARVAQRTAGGQTDADYRIPKGLNLRDEIGRYWRMAQAHWADFAAGRAAGAEPKGLADRFLTSLLPDAFGFASLTDVARVAVGDRGYTIARAALGGRVPVVIAPAASGLDTLSPMFGDGTRRRSAFGLVQEYLNAQDGALWGVASDGVALRIIRDNASLTRPAWIEADLQRIFTEERYADFAALWLLLHETRFGRDEQAAGECALEAWREAGKEEGTRAREHLRKGVEEALAGLGQGFLAHPENGELRAALRSGALATTDYFNQLLRLVYRLIFLLTVEERNLLHPDTTREAAKTLYAQGYSLRRLRERSVRRSAHDRYSDLWDAARIVFRGLSGGEPRLGLPALKGIFALEQCAALDAARLENRALLLAVFRLAWLRQDGNLARVNWRDMGPEELGSVYESLLELVPQVTLEGRRFRFASGGETKGNARKTSGSYYTPDSLVQVLLDSALEPVMIDAVTRNPNRPVAALLELSIVDPACGSGHFLLAAARRLAASVARLQANGTPSAAEYRHALRQVVGHCIYGVDLNPMAVELCKVSLWMEAVEPGLPLTFLDSHIQCGNALLGTTPELMTGGVPDAAWDPIEGDDKKTASALKKKNKAAATGQRGMSSLWTEPSKAEGDDVLRAVTELDAAPDGDVASLTQKETRWETILGSDAYRHQKFVADAWCAAFVWPKQAGPSVDAAPTNELWRQLRDRQGHPPTFTAKTTDALAGQYGFFHWHLQFPQVFAKGGFDVVLGNPPWERVKLQEQEFFASRSEEIASAVNAAARKKLIAALPQTDAALWAAWYVASRNAEGQSHIIRSSGRYPLCGKGDVNTYAIFAEHNRAIIRPTGAMGCILPAGIATDDTTKDFFQSIVRSRSLRSIYHFENEERLFVGVNNMFRYVLLTVTGSAVRSEAADVVAFARTAEAVADAARHYSLSADEIKTINPNTETFPPFHRRRDADLNLALYHRAGVLWNESTPGGNPWRIQFMRMFDMANDSGLFWSRAELEAGGWKPENNHYVRDGSRSVPLYEAKMAHQFDHRFSTYKGATQANLNKGTLPQSTSEQHADPDFRVMPEYWVAEAKVESSLAGRWQRQWFLGWRDITNAHNERTVIASLIPRVAVGHKFLLMLTAEAPELVACLYASLCSFALDYTARQKVGGTSLNYFTMRQLPILGPSAYSADLPWQPGAVVREWLLLRVMELTYTSWDLQLFALDVGYQGPPFRWDPARRQLLRAELDAAFFHLYGLSRDDTAYVMDTFPIVRKNDEKAFGEYRTKRLILEIFDEMADAARTGRSYQTRLDPPPSDPRVAHTDTRTRP